MSTRKVTLYATKGGTKKVDTDATTWGELKPIVEEYYDLSNLQPTENVNKTTLLHADAVLPEGPFVLFLRPVKTKSGLGGTENKGFRELRAMITDDAIKQHLGNQVEGKNWTQLGTEDLRAGLASYELPTSPGQIAEVETEVETEIEVEIEVETEVEQVTPLDKAKKVKQLLEEICEETNNSDICDRIEFITDEVDGVISDLDEEGQKLNAEFRDLEQGF